MIRVIARHDWSAEPVSSSSRRTACAALATCGRERDVAMLVDPRLLSCTTHDAVRAYLAQLDPAPRSGDHLLAGVTLTWNGHRDGALACFDASRDAALEERRFHRAVAARARRSHHALLFGEVATARSAIEEARSLAAAHNLPRWRARCGAQLANLALDTGDRDAARAAVAEAAIAGSASDLLVLFAPAATELASGEHTALAEAWSQQRLSEIALRSTDRTVVTAAAEAAISRSRLPSPDSTLALRRALMLADEPTEAVPLLARTAERGEAAESRAAVDLLRAVPAPHRPYLEAHYRLAQAHLLMRSAQTDEAVGAAGEAARAFDRLKLPRWSNEAMLLLVRDQGQRNWRAERRKTPSSLTKREHQVTLLIRRGASNREVAAALGITEHTVERHVSSILSRLGLRSRWQIADSPLP